MTALVIAELAVDLGPHRALDGVDLSVARGERLVVLGPSGAGKTTLLRAIAGLVAPRRGRISLAGALATDGARVVVPPERRGVGLVFQELALWAGVTVEETIAVAARGTAAERRTRAGELARRLGLGDRLRATPDALSGGERQRVAFARALAGRPAVLLLDEPFAHLDAPLRRGLVDDLLALTADEGAALVAVSHDRRDALELGQRLVVLDHGRVVDQGSVADVARAPRAAVTAGLLELGSVVAGTVDAEGRLATPLGPVPLVVRAGERLEPGTAARALVAPDRVRLGEAGVAAVVRRVALLEPAAERWRVVVGLEGGLAVDVEVRGAPPAVGAAVKVAVAGGPVPRVT